MLIARFHLDGPGFLLEIVKLISYRIILERVNF